MHPASNWLLVACCVVCFTRAICQSSDDGYRLPRRGSYVVTAPRTVRPAQEVGVHVVLLRPSRVVLRAAISRDGVQVAGTAQRFDSLTTTLLKLKMPADASPGRYTLRVTCRRVTGGVIFQNVSVLTFHAKHVSVFIHTDKMVYLKKSTVRFRVVALTPNLMPASGSMNILIKDAKGHVVRKWIAKQINRGYYEGYFATNHPAKHGWWTILVKGWCLVTDIMGYQYKTHFKTESIYKHDHEVNVTLPAFVMDDDYSVSGIVMANHSSGRPTFGNATVELEIWPPGSKKPAMTINLYIPMFRGVAPFLFTLKEIGEHVASLADTVLIVRARVAGWAILGEEMATARTRIHTRTCSLAFVGGMVRVFKPGQPFKVYIAVLQSGRRLRDFVNQRVLIETTPVSPSGVRGEVDRRLHDIATDSVVRYVTTPPYDVSTLIVRASCEYSPGNSVRLVASRRHSPTNQTLSVTSSTESVRVDTYVVFTVRVSTFVPQIFYQVVSKGNIVLENVLQMRSRQQTFSLAASRHLMPHARIIVFCVLTNDEVLEDSLSFFVGGIRSDQLDIRINKGKDFRGNIAELVSAGDPGSIVAFTAEQYDLYTRRSSKVNQFFTQHEVEEELASYTTDGATHFQHTWLEEGQRRTNVHFNTPSYAIDAASTFHHAGLVVFTDTTLTRFPGVERCNASVDQLPCYGGGCYSPAERCDGVWDCGDGADEMACTPQITFTPEEPFDDLSRLWLHMDDHMWAWKQSYLKANGRLQLTLSVPQRPNIWMINAFSLSADRGLAFAEQPITLDTTRAFLVKLQAPSAAVRGEQLGVRVALFNHGHQPLEVLVTLHGSKSYKFVVVDNEFGVVSSYDPTAITGDVMTLVYPFPPNPTVLVFQLDAGKSRFVYFPIIPRVVGKFSVTIDASSLWNKYTVKKTIKIVYDGVTNHYHTPYLIDLLNKGSVMIPHLQLPVPERFIAPESRLHRFVPGSQRVSISISGDVVGMDASRPQHTLYSLLGYIYGTAEHASFHLQLNLVWLRYLRTTNQLKPALRKAAIGAMNKNLQEIYSFTQSNGGTAIRRKRSPTDTWSTALALEALALAASSQSEWVYEMFVDRSVIVRLAAWLLRQQNTTSGAFLRTAGIFDLRLLSNLTTDDGLAMNISETACSVVALVAARPVLTGETKTQSASSVLLAVEYLARHLNALTDPYDVCLVTYVLHLTNHRRRGAAFEKMRKMQRKSKLGDLRYWSRSPIADNEMLVINTVSYQMARAMPPVGQSRAVQATAYGLMVHLRRHMMREATPIMHWLQTQRNRQAAFAASQDTLRAVQALVEYARRDTNRDISQLVVDLKCSADPDWRRSVHLRRGQFSRMATLTLPVKYGSIIATAKGTGVALIQLSTSVNVEHHQFLREPPVRSFDLEVDKLFFWGRNDSHFDMNVCVRWTRTDIAERSGSVNLEIDIPTGFYVRKEALRKYQRAGRIHSKRSRFTKQKVVMYFDYLDTNRNCWFLTAERWFPVANGTIQHQIRVYDNYEPALQNTTFYTTYNLFHLHICQVCGSFQCPYCPDYNGAVTRRPSPALLGSLALCTALLLAALRSPTTHLRSP